MFVSRLGNHMQFTSLANPMLLLTVGGSTRTTQLGFTAQSQNLELSSLNPKIDRK